MEDDLLDQTLEEETDYEEELDDEDLIADAHHRLNALISVLLKKGVVTEEELEAEGALLEDEESDEESL